MARAMASSDVSADSSTESSSEDQTSTGEEAMELSCSSSSFSGGESSDHEPEGVHPFLYEPAGSSTSGSSSPESDTEESEAVSPRLLNLDW